MFFQILPGRCCFCRLLMPSLCLKTPNQLLLLKHLPRPRIYKLRAISSVVERLFDVEKVIGSIPISPTSAKTPFCKNGRFLSDPSDQKRSSNIFPKRSLCLRGRGGHFCAVALIAI